MRFSRPSHIKKTYFIGFCSLLLGLTANSLHVQASTPRVKISLAIPHEIKVEVDGLEPASSWSFLNAYAGAVSLGERIENFQALRTGQLVRVTKVASGEFRSDAPADLIRYVVRTASHLSYLPYVSGLTEDQAVLLPADLLPESLSNTELAIEFDLPEGWRVESSLNPGGSNRYRLKRPERSAFLAGPDLRVENRSVKGIPMRVVVTGQWPFSDKTVLKSASDVLEQYYSMVGFKLPESPVIFIARLPLSNSKWKAETRGSTVTLLLNPGVKLRNWRGQLGVIFTHEIFHLWVPNSLSLKGEYDWFFEGFTMYVAMLVAIKLKLIDFQEYLNTLSRVYNSYLAAPDDQTLIQASASRWTTSSSLVYNKGMLVAFIYDLTLRSNTQGQSTLSALYPLLFRSADEPASANDVIISLLTSSPSTSSFSKSYIESTDRIHLERVLPAFGFQVSNGSDPLIRVRKDLTDEQKKLLHSFGYRK
jgi:predicted metalloprotease with PDZ domain